jgi:ring-1,2-phenylacetyl-CoA epoxidase subunit PaaC
MELREALFNYLLRIGDTSLIAGQRLAEWVSKGPTLEEDIALTNIGLDLIGQARAALSYAAEIEGKGNTEDSLAFSRSEREYYNTLLSEQKNGNFADTIAKLFLSDAFFYHFYKALGKSKDEKLAAFALKSIKEVSYHLRHSGEWVIRLGDGTQESKEKIQHAMNDLWMFTGDLFEMNEVDEELISMGIGVDLNEIKTLWDATVDEVLSRATLTRPNDAYMQTGRLDAMHTEALGHILTEMQHLQRAYPNSKW